MTEKEYLVSVYAFNPFGPARIRLLISYFKSSAKIWKASYQELLAVGLKERTISGFFEFKKSFDPVSYFRKLKKLKIEAVTFKDEAYPQNLLGLEDAPPVLYLKGKIKRKDENAIAIVGARKATSYGREVAEIFAAELGNLGVTIVSGLARGIDTVGHKIALEVGARTMAVLGCGLDLVYPPENFSLAKLIVEKDGALISEYPLGYPALRNNFAERNRIISGLSKAVIVIEGEKKSGTLLTASHAANQGRTVFAVPGQITSPMSEAPHFLIQNGAKIAFSVRDILEELDLQLKVDKDKVEKILPRTKEEEKIWEILSAEELHLDEIARISGLGVAEISARLTIMEMKGLVKNTGGGVYKRL